MSIFCSGLKKSTGERNAGAGVSISYPEDCNCARSISTQQGQHPSQEEHLRHTYNLVCSNCTDTQILSPYLHTGPAEVNMCPSSHVREHPNVLLKAEDHDVNMYLAGMKKIIQCHQDTR